MGKTNAEKMLVNITQYIQVHCTVYPYVIHAIYSSVLCKSRTYVPPHRCNTRIVITGMYTSVTRVTSTWGTVYLSGKIHDKYYRNWWGQHYRST